MKKIKTSPHTPTELSVERMGNNRALISVWPFESGYGVTIAHPLKRLLLASSVGFAVTAVKIEGAKHEFDSIRGMLEDVTQLILNLKNVRFKIRDDRKKVEVSYSFSGTREITGKDLANDDVEVSNADIHFATLNEDGVLNFSVVIEKGMGYIPSEDIRAGIGEGYIPLDAFFTPVKKANYEIQKVLVEDSPDYEKVIFDLTTDGQSDPVELFKETVSGMYKQMAVFNKAFGLAATTDNSAEEDDAELKRLLMSIDDLNLSARSHNGLGRSEIKYMGELILMSEKELSELKNLGKKSVDEIRAKIEEMGYGVGADIPEALKNVFKQKLAQLKG